MSLKILKPQPVPELTMKIAHAAFPKGNLYLTMRDELGTIYDDNLFCDLFPNNGQPALAPWRLALITIMQFVEGLSDREAANAVRGRIDWKYALSLELEDSGFDFSVLCEFRTRLIHRHHEHLLFEAMLKHFKEKGLVKERTNQRTDSTHILAKIRALNRLECVHETLRAALNVLAVLEPQWLSSVVPPDWFERYDKRLDEFRLPKQPSQREELALVVGQDGFYLFEMLKHHPPEAMEGLIKLKAIERLRRVWLQHYQFSEGQLQWRPNDNLPPAGLMISSPYDEEARYARKGTTSWVGYKIHLTETCGTVMAETSNPAQYLDQPVSAELQDYAQIGEKDDAGPGAGEGRELPHLITNVETTIACAGDVSVTSNIHNHLHQQQLLPANHIVDTGFVDARLVLESEHDFKVNLVGPSRGDYKWQAQQGKGFAAANFEIDWQAQKAHCPGGKESSSWSEAIDGRDKAVIKIKFAHRDCQDCVFRTDCTRSKLARRTITIRPQEQYQVLQQGRKEQIEANWKEMYQQRAGIEGTISQGVRGFGMRRTRYIGEAKTHLQHLATASALNLVRVVAWLDGERPSKTRTSHFAALKKVA